MSNSVSEDTAPPGPGSSKMPELGDQAQSPAALHQITRQNATSSPLLRLSAEVRNMVFNYVFQDEIYAINPGPLTRKRLSSRRKLGPFLVSRQLYHETALLPYKLGVFQLGDHSWDHCILSRLKAFLWGRSKAQIEVMARIECYDSRYMDTKVVGTGVYWAAELHLT
ncbi:hypothetical protein IG631_14360 [Alternaria alternata]|nr:hypothetical protein IG631_14360 [Alternaria alternata]